MTERSAVQELDQRIRTAAFAFLAEQSQLHPQGLPRSLLTQGFVFEGNRVPLLGPPGIFKPRILADMPLSITTVPVVRGRDRPYEDEVDPSGLLLYRYRRTSPDHPDNVGLRRAMQRRVPLVYFAGLVEGIYWPIFPVLVVEDDRAAMTFRVAVEDLMSQPRAADGAQVIGEDRRRYITREVRQRLHQVLFSAQVLDAYKERCAVCRIGHYELLDAAHILPDTHPKGLPVVPNGLALCKLHHAAFDGNILGVRPDLVVEIREDILREHDGPMLVHGLQGFQGGPLRNVPRAAGLRPDRELLEERYEMFRRAG